MTLPEFLEKLEQTPRKWRESSQGEILCGNRCPISALQERPASQFAEVGEELGLERQLMHAIACAADNDKGHVPDIRAKLLKACGLESA